MDNNFLTEIIPLYRKPGIFSENFCYFQLFTSNTLGRKYPQAAQETRKNKKAETPCSPHNVPTLALGSTYFQKSTHEVKVGHTLRHQGLKLTTFSWLPFPQILHSGASCLIVVKPVDLFLFLIPTSRTIIRTSCFLDCRIRVILWYRNPSLLRL